VPPTPEEVRSELETILGSRSFASSTRLSRFLRFVVERTLAGDGERLKEYVLGVEVFDRDENYDPRIDSIVRVEAGRVRTKLEEYYGGEGVGAALRIRIQKGGYAPLFERRSETPPGNGGTPANGVAVAPNGGAESGRVPPSASARRASSRLVLGGIAAIATLAVVAFLGVRLATEPRAPRYAIAVLPFTHYGSDTATDALVTRLTERVTAELVRRGEIMVIASTSARAAAEGSRPARAISRELDAQFLLQARARREGGRLFVEALLVNGARDQKFWADSFSAGEDEIDELARRVAAGAAAAILSVSEIPAATGQ
jgi:TolB-like protein